MCAGLKLIRSSQESLIADYFGPAVPRAPFQGHVVMCDVVSQAERTRCLVLLPALRKTLDA